MSAQLNGISFGFRAYIFRVINLAGAGIDSVTLTITGDADRTFTTDINGYVLVGVASGTVEATKNAITVSQLYDFDGEPEDHIIEILLAVPEGGYAAAKLYGITAANAISTPASLPTGVCKYIEYAFFDGTGRNRYNDKTAILERKVVAGDVIAFELHKSGAKIADLNSATLGTFYATFAAQPLYVGYVLNWQNVATTHGSGIYQIVTKKTILGSESTKTSHDYHLMNYTNERANQTVKIEAWQTGYILDGFDYRNLLTDGWFESIRFIGEFGNKKYKSEVDKYLDSTYKTRQITTEIIDEFDLTTGFLPMTVLDNLVKVKCLANRIRINDYNNPNELIYENLEVSLLDVSNEPSGGAINQRATLKFEMDTRKTRKRN